MSISIYTWLKHKLYEPYSHNMRIQQIIIACIFSIKFPKGYQKTNTMSIFIRYIYTKFGNLCYLIWYDMVLGVDIQEKQYHINFIQIYIVTTTLTISILVYPPTIHSLNHWCIAEYTYLSNQCRTENRNWKIFIEIIENINSIK